MNQSENLEESIFTEARSLTDLAEREQFVRDRCGADQKLEQRVRALLRILADENTFLERPVETTVDIDLVYSDAETVGSSIGPYVLLEEIGSGGMGIVFLAQQISPVRRQVALKIIRPGTDSRDVVQRFLAERQTLAHLNHPGITRLLDAGMTVTGRPWFAMELARGPTITDFCTQQSVSIAERVRLFQTVCEAVQHAHQNSVIHRDLKPANVVVIEVNGHPVPKVVDFGVAIVRPPAVQKNTVAEITIESEAAPTIVTSSAIIGTPAYMSPEQTMLPDEQLDERCDVYSLGMLLYHMLTDSRPFPGISWQNAGLTETRRIIQEVTPVIPSERVLSGVELASTNSVQSTRRSGIEAQRQAGQLQGDLDWITMKAVEKNRNDRYCSVSEFAADLRRYLNHEPVHARSPSRLYRLRKLFRHRKSRVVATASVIGTLIIGIVAMTIGLTLIRERETLSEHRTQIEEQRTMLQRQSTVAALQAGYAEYFRGRVEVARQKVHAYESSAAAILEPGFAARYLERLCQIEPQILNGSAGKVFGVTFSPDSQLIVSCFGDTRFGVDIRNVATGELVRSFSSFENDVNCALFNADGSKLITAGDDRMVRVWDIQEGEELCRLAGFDLPLATVYLAGDGRTLITSGVEWQTKRATTWICDLDDATRRVPIPGQFLLDVDEESRVAMLVSDAGDVTLRSFPTLDVIRSLPGIQPGIVCGTLAHKGKLLATGSMDGNTHLRQLTEISDTTLMRAAPLPPAIRDVAFSIDDRFLIEVMGTGVIQIWDISTRTVQKVLLANNRSAWSGAVSPDGKWLAIGTEDGITELHSLQKIAELRQPIRQLQTSNSDTSVDRISRDYAVLNGSGNIDLYSSDNHRLIQTIVAPKNVVFRNAEFSADGKSLWITDTLGSVFNFERTTEKISQALLTYGQPITPPIFTGNGKFFAVSTSNVDADAGFVWSGVQETESGKVVFRLPEKLNNRMLTPHRVNTFLDHSTAVSTQENTIARWNLVTGMEILPRFEEPHGWIFHVAPAPDHHSLLLGLRDATVCIWDPTSNRVTDEFLGLKSTLNASTFSADGKTLVTATHAGEVSLWDLPTGLLICELHGAKGSISDIWFSKDERRLLAFVNEFRGNSPTGNSEVFVWDATEP